MELDPRIQESIVRSLAVVFLSLLAYLLPSFIAWYRSHHNTTAIVACNLLLGWTVVGWIGTFIWALTRPPART